MSLLSFIQDAGENLFRKPEPLAQAAQAADNSYPGQKPRIPALA